MPDGATKPFWELRAGFRTGRHATISVRHDRRPLLRTATATSAAPTMDATELSVRYDGGGVLASAAARRFEFFDDNDGVGADAWLLLPLARRGSAFTLRAGGSAAYRDTARPHFRLDRVSSLLRPGGSFDYFYRGVYDPYWTPHNQREARAVASAEGRPHRRLTVRLQGDYGVARDEVIAFYPPTGAAPLPAAVEEFVVPRSFNPWRVSAGFTAEIGRRLVIDAGFARDSTAFYRANELRLRLGGRF